MKPLHRVQTHIRGLDQLLGGGLVECGVYFLQGRPGVGKTILANHLCFEFIRRSGKAVYLTLLAESHTRLMQTLLGHTFFDPARVPEDICYMSGYQALQGGGLKGVVQLIQQEIAARRAGLVVLDGVVVPKTGVDDETRAVKEFVHQLQGLATLHGACILLVTSGFGDSADAERTMVDGILTLEETQMGMRGERTLEVAKFRGGPTVRGRHSFCITDDGIKIYPRLESVTTQPTRAEPGTAMATGIADLDRLLGGAIAGGTATVIQGPSGVGKTLLGLSYLVSGRKSTEPALLFGFHESPAILTRSAAGVGIDLAGAIEKGGVHFEWFAPGDEPLDELGYQLLELVDERRIKRLVIDSIVGFADKSFFAERGYRFLGALLNELRGRDVAICAVSDASALAAVGLTDFATGIASLFDNVIDIRADEDRRILRLHKLRLGPSQPTAVRLEISDGGLRLERLAGRAYA